MNNKKSCVDRIMCNGNILTDQREIAEEFCKFFTQVGQKQSDNIVRSDKNIEDYLMKSSTRNSIFLQPTDEYEVTQIIQSLKNNSSCGIDNISTNY